MRGRLRFGSGAGEEVGGARSATAAAGATTEDMDNVLVAGTDGAKKKYKYMHVFTHTSNHKDWLVAFFSLFFKVNMCENRSILIMYFLTVAKTL